MENQQVESMAGKNVTKQLPIHSKELPQTTKIHTEIMQQSLEKQLAEAREEKLIWKRLIIMLSTKKNTPKKISKSSH